MFQPQRQSNSIYVAVVGDIVESRALADRRSVQDRLRLAISDFNERHATALSAPLALTGGDELKTIFEDPAVAVDVITRISDRLHPVSLTWGVGRGPIETSWVHDVGALDGPCFHRAREGIEAATGSGAWVGVRGFSPLDDRLMTGIFRLLAALRASWTDKQLAYVRAVRGERQRDVARRFDVTESAVSQALRRARYHEVEEGETVLRELLASYANGRSGPHRPSRAEPATS